MPDPKPTITYATPQPKFSFPIFLRGPLVFWTAGIATAITQCAIAIFGPLRAWNSYLGRDGSLYIDAIVIFIAFTLAALVIVFFMEVLTFLIPRLEVRPSFVFWITIGILFGLCLTLPHSIDIALNDRSTRRGYPANSGWGLTVIRYSYFALLPLISLLALRRKPHNPPDSPGFTRG
jgi:hypothetical protein